MPSILTSALAAMVLAAAQRGVELSAPAPTPGGPAAELSAGPTPPVATLALERLFGDPRPWLGREVRFSFQLAAVPEQWNPYMTRFGTRDHVAAEVWGDGQFLWREQDFHHPLGLVFALRGSQPARLLAEAAPYQRFTARARVVEVFASRPWAELIELTPERLSVGEGTILHASRALRLMASEDWLLAREDLVRAGVTRLPQRAREELDRLLAQCDRELAQRAARQIPVNRAR